MPHSGKITPFDPPVPVDGKATRKSRAESRPATAGGAGESTIVFGTFQVQAKPLREKPTPSGHFLWSMGLPDEIAPSQAIWGRGRWELTVGFTVHNLTPQTISLHDLRAHVYYATGVEMPLMMVIHRARIELTQDNSIFSDGRAFILRPKEVEQIELVMETSLYDTLSTTIVFGLFADYQAVEHKKAVTHRLPSDKIYIFQHQEQFPPGKCHFVARDAAGIRARAQEEPSNKVVQDMCESMEKIYQLHTAHDHTRPLPPPVFEEQSTAAQINDSELRRLKTQARPVWPQSFQEVSRLESAADLLRFCVFFDSTDIPIALIYEAFYQRSLSIYDELLEQSSSYEEQERERPRSSDAGKQYWRIHKLKDGTRARSEAIDRLIECGFFVPNPACTSISIPPTMGEHVFKSMDLRVKERCAEYAARALDAMLPDDTPLAASLYDMLLPHARTYSRWADQLGLQSNSVGRLVHQFAEHLFNSRRFAEAESFCAQAATIAEKTLGPEDFVVGVDMLYLAVTRRKLRQTGGVELLLKKAKRIFERTVGRQDEHYALAIHNLAAVYLDEGRYREAEPLFVEARPALEQVFGSSVTLAEALDEYAQLLVLMNRLAEARDLQERARAIRETA
jgi:tetratricopeptide (TPR) repeat protein